LEDVKRKWIVTTHPVSLSGTTIVHGYPGARFVGFDVDSEGPMPPYRHTQFGSGILIFTIAV
jgi:hypothetical protein